MSEQGLFGRPVQLTVRALFALAFSMLALGAGGAIVYFMDDVSPSEGREADHSPVKSEPVVSSSYEAVIRPLFDAKCSECHGEKKQKSGLSLATPETIAKGGRHGPAVNPSAPPASLMLQRIELALDEEKHMPPDDHDQLSAGELAALKAWILAGAPFQGVVSGIQAEASKPVVPVAAVSAPVLFELPPADPAALAALREALVHVQPMGQDYPTLLWVDFAAVAKSIDDARALALLTPIVRQLCDVSLARTAVGDETIALLVGSKSLRRLDLRGTAVSDKGVAALADHATLADLVLAQTKLTDAALDSLIRMPGLQSVHLWHSGLSPEAIGRLKSARPQLRVDDGAAADSTALEAETAIALTKTPVVAEAVPASSGSAASPSLAPVNTKCPVSGSPVNPKFSIVHDGRVIGFCCPNCPKEFWADPAKFIDRLN